MLVKPIDTFITSSVKLFEANPSQTAISLVYRKPHRSKTAKVAFKTHNPGLSANFKFRTNRSKDVSRLLSSLGPTGVSVKLEKVERRKLTNARALKKLTKKKRKVAKKDVRNIVGMSTLLINTDAKEYIPEPSPASKVNNSNSTSSKKKKTKSKNKKKH